MKKKILFMNYSMDIGGSIKSLIALLNNIDYEKYEVDLLLLNKCGVFLKDVPKVVNIIDFSQVEFQKQLMTVISSYLLGIFARVLNKITFWRKGNKSKYFQMIAYYDVKRFGKMKKNYNIAIGAMELLPCYYVCENVKAEKKIAWIHTDYEQAGFDAKFDKKLLGRFDNIVLVSEECKKSFIKIFPEYHKEALVIENILDPKSIRLKAQEKVQEIDVSFDGLKIVTVCRLHNYSKALDRLIIIIKRLVDEGKRINWYVVGDGPDKESIKDLVKTLGLDEYVILLGEKSNPYPYIYSCDLFALPSRYEGKPIVITEAQIIGRPAFVTNYKSASEQITNNYDGIIVENSEEAIYIGLKRIIESPGILEDMEKNVKDKEFHYNKWIEVFKSLL